jgi:hypothetical protein
MEQKRAKRRNYHAERRERSREMKRHERRNWLLLNESIVLWRRKKPLPGKHIYNKHSSVCYVLWYKFPQKMWKMLFDHAGESQLQSHPTFQQWWEDLAYQISCNSSH